MNANEGLRRIVKAVSVIAWCLLFAILAGVLVTLIFDPNDSAVMLGVAVAGLMVFAVIQGVAWVISGFGGAAAPDDGLVRWSDLIRSARRVRRPNPSEGQTAARSPAAVNPVDASLHGVGGWLAWLVVGLLVVGPLASLGSNANGITNLEQQYPSLLQNDGWGTAKALSWGFTIAMALWSISAGYRLKKAYRPSSVNFALFMFWGNVILGVISTMAVSVSLNVAISDAFGSVEVQGIVRSAIVAAVWTLYLLKSKRVRQTYYNENMIRSQIRAEPAA